MHEIDADAPVPDAVAEMVEHNVGSLLVTDSGRVTEIVFLTADRRRAGGTVGRFRSAQQSFELECLTQYMTAH